MQTYWDLSERERSELDQEGVKKFLDAELMTKGVLKVDAPQLEEVSSVPSLAETDHWKVEWPDAEYSYSVFAPELVFASAEQAQAFVDTQPKRLRTDYSTKASHVEVLTEGRIIGVKAVSHHDYLNAKTALEAAAAVRNRNTAAENEHSTACAEMQKVLSGVWDDWSECREKAARHQKVDDTLDEYAKIAEDGDMALKFLLKAFTRAEVTAAYEWFGRECPELPAEELEVVEEVPA